jgi:hypothetical protein
MAAPPGGQGLDDGDVGVSRRGGRELRRLEPPATRPRAPSGRTIRFRTAVGLVSTNGPGPWQHVFGLFGTALQNRLAFSIQAL